MKTKLKILLLSISCLPLSAQEPPQYEWVEGKDVFVGEDGFYADSNRGLERLNVLEYDRANDRYLIENIYRKEGP